MKFDSLEILTIRESFFKAVLIILLYNRLASRPSDRLKFDDTNVLKTIKLGVRLLLLDAYVQDSKLIRIKILLLRVNRAVGG